MIEQDEIERKFLIKSFLPECEWPVAYADSVITQIYLYNHGLTERLRRRLYVDTGWEELTHNRKRFVDRGHYREEERKITQVAFDILLKARRDPKLREIQKVRKVFTWGDLLWELDVFQVPSGVVVMEVELLSLDVELTFPPFIQIEREVTGKKGWSNKAMAAPDWSPPLSRVD